MDFKNLPKNVRPAYAWFWNSNITKEGIDARIDEMLECGIGAFYVIAEPDNWFPDCRATHLYPKYLSDEYIDLLFYAFEKAEEKGIYTWLYNEGAYPSGAACGLVTDKYPELKYKVITTSKIQLKKGESYKSGENTLAAFKDEKRIFDGYTFSEDTEITEYAWADSLNHRMSIRVDNAERRGTDEFMKITHERLKARFGEHMGKEIVYMFDDEPDMGSWTKDFDKLFEEKYGYDIKDFLPVVAPRGKTPVTDAEYRAVSDYMMLCGDLLTENYFIPMRDWLHKTNMLSIGHLNNDDKAKCAFIMRYGNVMKMIRAYDVPGIDVIWEQITYPKNGSCCFESMEMFPRLASSAARQIGGNISLSESFAVYGAHVTPDLMRFAVNFQAVRGINLFNFMAMSYDRETPMRHQFRPNFIGDNVGMDCLRQINEYTARLSHIMQEGRAEIKTALYYPFRTICASGEKGEESAKSFEELGRMLEEKGVSFDFIDEEFVLESTVKNGSLVGEFVTYENVFVPKGELELSEVNEKLKLISSKIEPDITRTNPKLLTRKMLFSDGSEGYFIFNQSGEALKESIEIRSDKNLYEIDLFDGEIYSVPCKKESGVILADISLLCGEGIFLLLSDEIPNVTFRPKWERVCELTEARSRISRIYKLDMEKGVRNEYPENEWQDGFVLWDESLSGEATYIFTLPTLDAGEYRLDLGEVRHYAKVFLNGEKIGECTMPPYTIELGSLGGGEELKIIVANTPANECARSDYFEKNQEKDVGPYHQKMVISERKEGAGGLLQKISLEKKIIL